MPAKKKHATLEDLLGKTARTVEVPISDGGPSILFTSIGLKRYDDLIGEHPPTKEQGKEGALWNQETFPIALIAECSVEPKLTVDDVTGLWESEAWSKGELMDIFLAVMKLNSEGLNVPFTGKG